MRTNITISLFLIFIIYSKNISAQCIQTAPYHYGLENNGSLDTCWIQSNDDNQDWTIHTGSTSSNGTGPNGANDGLFYAYFESSNPVASGDSAILISPSINTSNLNIPALYFHYHMFGNDSMKLKVEYELNNSNSWTKIWEQKGSVQNSSLDSFKRAYIAIPPAINSTIRIRFTAVAGTNNGSTPGAGFAWQSDIAIDDVIIDEVILNDVAIEDITVPNNNCGLGIQSILVKVKNIGYNTQNNIPVISSTTFDNITSQDTVLINLISNGGISNINFPVEMSQVGEYSFSATINLPNDSDISNNSNSKTSYSQPNITSFPYTENWDNFDGFWSSSGSWEHGIPSSNIISSAASGQKAFVTNLDGNYLEDEISYLTSPCFDLSNINTPILRFSIFWEIEDDWDGAWLEYSTDGGNIWQKLGVDSLSGQNWYTDSITNNPFGWCWNGTGNNGSNGWVDAMIDLSLNGINTPQNIRFRFVVVSDLVVVHEGLGIDNFGIFDGCVQVITNEVLVNESSNGANDGSIVLNPTNGFGHYSYLWSNGQTTNNIINLSSGAYTVTITDILSCVTTATFNLNGGGCPNSFNILTNTTSSFNGNTADISIISITDGINPYTYNWSTGDTTSTIVDLPNGLYNIVITDSIGCSDTAIIYVSISSSICNLILSTSSTPVIGQGNNNGSATVIVTNGISPYSYQWSNGDTTQTISGLSTGFYSVTVTDSNNCTDTTSIIVSLNPCNITLSISSTPVIGQGNSNGSATVVATNGTSPYSYQWSSGDTTISAFNLSDGNYIVTVTDSDGCTETTQVSINTFSIGLPNNITFCEGTHPIILPIQDYQTLNVDSFTLNWSINDTIQTPVFVDWSNVGYSNPTSDTTIFLGNYDFYANNQYSIKFWVSTFDGINIPPSSYDTTETIANVFSIPSAPINLLPVDGTDNLDKTIYLSWSPSTNATSYDIYIWEDSNGAVVPTNSTISNISQVNYLYSNNALEYGKTYNWQVVAKNGGCEITSNTQSFTLRTLPELMVTNVQVPNNPSSGQTIQISYSILNQGGSSGVNTQWNDLIWLSLDTLVDGGDILLRTTSNLIALNNGQNYTNTVTVTLPQGIQNNFYIIVATDYYNTVLENNDTNNINYNSMLVSLTPPPDLVVTSIITPPISLFSGQPLTFSYTVKNVGTGITSNGNWIDRIYISSDSTFSNAATLLSTVSHSGFLEVDSLYTNNVTITMPQGIFGAYFIIIETDAGNDVFEFTLENNNFRISDSLNVLLSPFSNLQISNISILDTVSNNEQVTIQWMVANNGTSVALGNWSDYIAIREVGDTNNIFLGIKHYSGGLNPNASYNAQLNVTIPQNLRGNYEVLIYTDSYNTVYEYLFENDNFIIDTLTVINADLVVSSVNNINMISSGQTLVIDWTIVNQGEGDIYNRNTTDGIYLSTYYVYNPDSIIYLSDLSYNLTLLANGSVTKSQTVTIPNGISGNYYIYIVADRFDNITEPLGNNINVNSSTLNVILSPYPNLVVSSINNLPDTISINSTLQFSAQISNNGQSDITNIWEDRIYISDNPIWNITDAVLLSSSQQLNGLSIGGNYTLNETLYFALNSLYNQGISNSGTYYFYVFTDADDNIYEYGQDNNDNITRSNPVYLRFPTPVDFQVLNATTNTVNSTSGQSISIQYTVQNIGTTTNIWNYYYWGDAAYLSTDTIWDNNDILVDAWLVNGAIDSLSTYNESRTMTVPNGISGVYYLIIVTDNSNQTNDNNRINNTYTINTPIYFNPISYSDLRGVSLSTQSQAIAGQPIRLYYEIENIGDTTTHLSNWNDGFTLLSSNSIIPLTSKARTDSLQVGQSYIDSIDAFLPITAGGNSFIRLQTDAGNLEYETDESNNEISQYIFIDQLPPSDLVVDSISTPFMGYVGTPITVNYNVNNNGVFPSLGYRRDIIHFSTDSILDAQDILFSVITYNNTNIAPNTYQTGVVTDVIPSLALGEYHIIVQTDILNNIFESNDTNNTTISTHKIMVTVPELIIDIAKQDTLTNSTELLYRIEIPDSLAGETLLISINGDSINGINELYTSYGIAPTRSNHDFSQVTPYEDEQQLVIPTLQSGTYYVLAYGNTTNSNFQVVSLLAEILPFELRSVQTNQGGNTGNVTVKIEGAKFESPMVISLESDSLGIINANNYLLQNSTTLFATFDLQGESLGFYDVKLRKLNNDTAVLVNGFEIVPGSIGSGNLVGGGSNNGNSNYTCTISFEGEETILNTNIIHPPNTRPNQVVPITIQFSNNGNVDLPIPTRFIIALEGAPLSFDANQFNLSNQQVFLEFRELNGPLDVLRPGAYGAITVYTKAVGQVLLRFTLTE